MYQAQESFCLRQHAVLSGYLGKYLGTYLRYIWWPRKRFIVRREWLGT